MKDTRTQAIAIAAAIFAARDFASIKGELQSPRAIKAMDDAIAKARYLVEVIERKLETR